MHSCYYLDVSIRWWSCTYILAIDVDLLPLLLRLCRLGLIHALDRIRFSLLLQQGIVQLYVPKSTSSMQLEQVVRFTQLQVAECDMALEFGTQ